VSYWRFYFRFFPGSIERPQIVRFLKDLQATIGKKLLIVWDRLQAHRFGTSAGVRAGIESVEYIWGYLKHHAMPNYCARDLTDLRQRASRNLRSMQRRGTLVSAF